MENRKLLLVDDVNLFLQLEKTFLTRRSFEIHTATNGDEAFQKARAVEPDLIVLDLHMPGMDGDVVCRLLKGDPHPGPAIDEVLPGKKERFIFDRVAKSPIRDFSLHGKGKASFSLSL
ncbi:MAG: response regulator, partial [bacterium]|nr:response regulator [bacterium]